MHCAQNAFTPESSPHDSHEYQWLWLDNGLPVLLAHNPQLTQSAAAFAVNAGHFQDPQDAAGVAHFLEHMLFLGSNPFPDPEAFAQAIQAASGHYNAWTATEHTNYYLTVRPDRFEPILEHFCSLFTQPLLASEWVEKERQSIEAEYQLKRNDELRRLYEVHKITANPLHPFAKFSVGNATTLADLPDLPVRQRLFDYWQTYYTAANAALVLIGPQSIAELTALAQVFASLPRSRLPEPMPEQPIYLPEQLGCKIFVRPLKDASRLIVTFSFPEINSDYLHKTTSFIAHILGDEGRGSLCHLLRSKHWISELSAGGGMSGYNFKDFNLNMMLTDLGLEHIDDILQTCYHYIRVVAQQGLRDDIYAERQQMQALNYRFPESQRPIDLAAQLVINMLHYHPQHVISGDYRMDGLRHQFASRLLAEMTPERSRITVIHRSVETNQMGHYYGAEYTIQPLTPEQLEYFRQAPADASELQPPQPNPYIPQRIEPLPLDQHSATHAGTKNDERSGYWPSLKSSSTSEKQTGVELWHLQDATFREPQAHIYLSLRLPMTTANARNNAISRIWCELALEELNERFYAAEVAGMHFNLYPQQSGVTLHLAGFSDRQSELFKALMQSLNAHRSTEQQFLTVRNQLAREWQAMNQNKPINHLFALLHHQLQYGAYTAQELAASIEDLDFELYCNLLPGMLRDAQATLLAHGDIDEKTAQELAHWVETTLPIVAEPRLQVQRTVKRLSSGVVSTKFSSQHSDHACALFVQGQTTEITEKASFLILNQLLGPRFFNRLRTQEQLGYLVGSSYVPMHGLPGLLCYVQSPHSSPAVLNEAMEAFLADFNQVLEQLSEDEFTSAQHSVIRQMQEAAPSLRVRAQRYWGAIINNNANFGLANDICHTVEVLTLPQIQAFFQRRFLSERCAMTLQSCSHTE